MWLNCPFSEIAAGSTYFRFIYPLFKSCLLLVESCSSFCLAAGSARAAKLVVSRDQQNKAGCAEWK